MKIADGGADEYRSALRATRNYEASVATILKWDRTGNEPDFRLPSLFALVIEALQCKASGKVSVSSIAFGAAAKQINSATAYHDLPRSLNTILLLLVLAIDSDPAHIIVLFLGLYLFTT